LSSRRSRSLLSRMSFAIVVFFLPLEAISIRPLSWSSERVLAGSSGCEGAEALVVVEPPDDPVATVPSGRSWAGFGGCCEAMTAQERGTALVRRTLDR
jgi:hypothetical protein